MNIYKDIYDARVKDSEETRALLVSVCERIVTLVIEEANSGHTLVDARRLLDITRTALRQLTQQNTTFQSNLRDILDKYAQANEQSNEKTLPN